MAVSIEGRLVITIIVTVAVYLIAAAISHYFDTK